MSQPTDDRPPARVLLLRHAETTAPDRFHGCESDVGLSVRGTCQADEVAPDIRGRKPAAIYCSGLRRAVETARRIARDVLPEPIVIEALHERRMGPLSNTPRAATWPIYEETRRRWMAGELDATHEGGESFAAIRDRIVPVFRELAQRHRGETIAVVAHGVVIRVALCSLVEGLGPRHFAELPIDYVRIYELLGDGQRWRLDTQAAPAAGARDPSPW
jgi:broad specificity phosphatase PhoE